MSMQAQIRSATREDANVCGEICYRAFCAIADQHNFPHEFPSVEVAKAVVTTMISKPAYYGIVAELDDRIVAHGAPGVRLVQTAYHNRSLSLYAKLGFEIREPLSVIIGKPLKTSTPGYTVRRATEADLKTCNELCFRTHGHDRGGDLCDSINDGMASVVEHHGRITGYSNGIGYGGHAVAESNDALKALISAAPTFLGAGFLVPSRNGDLLRWCFSKGLRLMQQMTLMTVGLYNEPKYPYLPSILF